MNPQTSTYNPEILASLRIRGLLAAGTQTTPAEVGLVPGGVDYTDKYAGALLGGACGDALGRPVEGSSPPAIRERYGRLMDFVPCRGWRGGPKGTITDDTQLTMCIAESIAATGSVDPVDLARRFVAWLPGGRGKGRATTEAVVRLQQGIPWWEAGAKSAGNGAAMRAAPIGMLHSMDLISILQDGAVSAIITHADAMAAASAIAQAFAVAYCLHRAPSEFQVEAFAVCLDNALASVPDPGARERRAGAGPETVRLADQLQLALKLRDRSPEEAFGRLHNGAFVLESLPAAFYCFAASPDDPERMIVTAANGGYDADTVAAMAGSLAGALNGASSLPDRWLDDLEYRSDLESLAGQILGLTSLTQGGQPPI